MCVGEIVIHNDVLGAVTQVNDKTCVVRDKNNRAYTFNVKDCTSVISPWALARMYYDKLMRLV